MFAAAAAAAVAACSKCRRSFKVTYIELQWTAKLQWVKASATSGLPA